MIISLRYSAVVTVLAVGDRRQIVYLWRRYWIVRRMYSGVLVVLWIWASGKLENKYLLSDTLYNVPKWVMVWGMCGWGSIVCGLNIVHE